VNVRFSFSFSCIRLLVPALRPNAKTITCDHFPTVASAVNYWSEFMFAVSLLGKFEDGNLSQDVQLHARSLQVLHEFQKQELNFHGMWKTSLLVGERL
jgi:hypothetical protein